jgi:beta-galactosidase
VAGQFFQQQSTPAGGHPVGRYANGHIAAMEKATGSGKTLLIGTFPGGGYFRSHFPETRDFFAGLLTWAGVRQQIQSSDPQIKARLHKGPGGTYVWVVNPTRTRRQVKISLPSGFQRATDLWQESNQPTVIGNTVAVSVEDRNAAVIRLE